jgi:hypothetical protein
VTKLTYSQLEGVWIDAGGQRSLAPLMAAIALAESGGNPTAVNATDNGGRQSSFGLWQISTGTHTPPASDWSDPNVNAKLAVGKLQSQGLGAWGTYSSGAFKAFMAMGVPPTSYTSSSSTAVDTAMGETGTDDTCAWNVSFPVSGSTCLLSKVQTRALLGGVLILTATTIFLVGIAVLVGNSMGKKATAFLPGVHNVA